MKLGDLWECQRCKEIMEVTAVNYPVITGADKYYWEVDCFHCRYHEIWELEKEEILKLKVIGEL